MSAEVSAGNGDGNGDGNGGGTSTGPGAGLRERAVQAAYFAGWALVRRLPEPVAYALFRLLADLLWWRRGRGVRRLEDNLRQVLPEADDPQVRATSRRGMRSYLRYWCELFRLPDWDADRTVGAVQVEGEEHFWTAVRSGRGAVIALPHMANWDHAGAWACRLGAPVTTVAERLRPEALFERFVAVRAGLGMRVLPLTGEGDVFGRLSATLASGGLVCLLGERDLGASGVPVDFFGTVARFPPGPALLAVRTGAALVPAGLHFAGRKLVITFGPEIPPPAGGGLAVRTRVMTQEIARHFERSIRAHPEDWHMLQRVWPGQDPAPAPPADRTANRSEQAGRS